MKLDKKLRISVRKVIDSHCRAQYGTRGVFVATVAGSMRSCILCCIPPVGRSCAYASSISRNHVLWKLTVFSREHQLRDYGRLGWEGAENGCTACLYDRGRPRAACLRACTWWSKSTVLEACDIRFLESLTPRVVIMEFNWMPLWF